MLHEWLRSLYCSFASGISNCKLKTSDSIILLKNWPTSASFCLFSVFTIKQKVHFYNNLMWKNVHPVSGTGIQTYNHLVMSQLPQPLDQGSFQKLDNLLLYKPAIRKSTPIGVRRMIHWEILIMTLLKAFRNWRMISASSPATAMPMPKTREQKMRPSMLVPSSHCSSVVVKGLKKTVFWVTLWCSTSVTRC